MNCCDEIFNVFYFSRAKFNISVDCFLFVFFLLHLNIALPDVSLPRKLLGNGWFHFAAVAQVGLVANLEICVWFCNGENFNKLDLPYQDPGDGGAGGELFNLHQPLLDIPKAHLHMFFYTALDHFAARIRWVSNLHL